MKLFGEVAVTMIGESSKATSVGALRFDPTLRERRRRGAGGRPLHPVHQRHDRQTQGCAREPPRARCTRRGRTMDRGVRRGATFIAWPPMFHMASADSMLVTLIGGGKVIVMDGLDVGVLRPWRARGQRRLVRADARHDRQGAGRIRAPGASAPADSVGCMADLVPRQQIVDVTRLFSTVSQHLRIDRSRPRAGQRGGRVPVVSPGEPRQEPEFAVPRATLVDRRAGCRTGRAHDSCCCAAHALFRLLGRTWATAEAFAGDGSHTGDVFTRQPDGTLQFVDRRKYLIKSGGENIYPAEIEQLLLASPRIADAAVVRKRDAKWGEVPVAFVSPCATKRSRRKKSSRCAAAHRELQSCRAVRFIRNEDVPRSTTGKIVRSGWRRCCSEGDWTHAWQPMVDAVGRDFGEGRTEVWGETIGSEHGAPLHRAARELDSELHSDAAFARAQLRGHRRAEHRHRELRDTPNGTPAIRRSLRRRGAGRLNPRATTSAACASAWSRPPRISSASTRKRTTCCRWSSATGCAGAAHCCCHLQTERDAGGTGRLHLLANRGDQPAPRAGRAAAHDVLPATTCCAPSLSPGARPGVGPASAHDAGSSPA